MRQVENFLFFWALWPCQTPITELSKSKKEKISIRDLLGTDDLTVYGTGGVPRQRCIIRIYEISAGDFSERLPPTQMVVLRSSKIPTKVKRCLPAGGGRSFSLKIESTDFFRA